jgi:magnesium chelatase family protein
VLATTNTCAHAGVSSYVVRVEARLTTGLPQLVVVGLPDAAVREGRERVRSAIRATSETFPLGRVVVNLSPASRPKGGASFDLAIAMALMGAAGLCELERLSRTVFVGELGLDGRVHTVPGILPAALAAAHAGHERIVVPRTNAAEAAIAKSADVYAVTDLREALQLVRGGFAAEPVSFDPVAHLAAAAREGSGTGEDLSEIRGQSPARRALEIAAAGGHHMLMIGPPGAGKTMLARRLPSILPAPTLEEAIETTSIHSIAGLNEGGALVARRPFRAPHHTTSGAGMVGGGANPSPGEISLAHNGVLFLDELPEYAPHVLNQLREPLQDGFLLVSRAGGRHRFPARILLVAAMNPCPCGFYATGVRSCRCAESALHRYRGRISGPLLDRIDLHVHVPRVEYEELSTPARQAPESSAAVRARVQTARTLLDRSPPKEDPPMTRDADRTLARASHRFGLSARAVRRTVAVAQTVAALDGRFEIGAADAIEALHYRQAVGQEAPPDACPPATAANLDSDDVRGADK